MALGKEQHSAKALFPECNTRGRSTLGKETCYLTVHPAHAVKTLKKILPRVPSLALGEEALSRVPEQGTQKFCFFVFFASFFCEAFPHYLKLPVQIWDNFDFFVIFR